MKVFVIAGNYSQFKAFCAKYFPIMDMNSTEFRNYDIVYVANRTTMLGIESPWGYKVGTWADREDIDDISNCIMSRRSTLDGDFIEVDL